MGLAERRAAQGFQNEQYPGWKERIEKAAGFPVPIEVAWDELAVPNFADDYGDFFPKVFFQPLVDALSAVTIDDLGRTAAREGITRIVIRNSGEHYGVSGFTFDSGVLTIDHKTDTNVDYVNDRTTGLRQLLESNL